ncbi:hypothetical protein AALP_AA6G199800 [Arabis alpina]|uniref:Uncharacterized protein n=1 Tax=Arabis alpina TaxID=50452 RepID=A0A087GQF7_ARAAL|nr:hypothetical protein AALP_AA6G199800 [Arabis alpina]
MREEDLLCMNEDGRERCLMPKTEMASGCPEHQSTECFHCSTSALDEILLLPPVLKLRNCRFLDFTWSHVPVCACHHGPIGSVLLEHLCCTKIRNLWLVVLV